METELPSPHLHETVYKGELVVGSISSVKVGQGSVLTSNISSTYQSVSYGDCSVFVLILTGLRLV